MKESNHSRPPESYPVTEQFVEPLSRYLLSLADDELLLGHRNSEWCGHAPILEEDIAFANLALDEIGHAAIWYNLLADLTGEDRETYPDRLVYWRAPEEYRNIQLVELPKGDWAFSILRQYLFDAAELERLAELEHSAYEPMAEAAAKIRREETYHHRHSLAWVKRLALGTDESHNRMQSALVSLWPFTRQLFAPQTGQAELQSAGIIPDSDRLASAWQARVVPVLEAGELEVPHLVDEPVPERSQHTPHLGVLLAEMQSIARLEPGGRW